MLLQLVVRWGDAGTSDAGNNTEEVVCTQSMVWVNDLDKKKNKIEYRTLFEINIERSL